MSSDAALAAAAVRQLPGVVSVHADAGAGGSLTALHVGLAAGSDESQARAAILRVAQAGRSAEQDPVQVHVTVAPGAQPADAPPPAGTPGTRPQVVSTEVALRGSQVEATVVLAAAERTATGRCAGSQAGSGVPRAVASATLRALEGLVQDDARLEFDGIDVHAPHDQPVVLVRLTLQHGSGPRQLTGSAAVRGDAHDAVVRAVLDAANRPLARLLG